MQRLALPFLISVIVHLVVLSQINWDSLHAKLNEQHRLTVSLMPASLPDERTSHVDSDRRHDPSSSAKTAEVTKVLDANESAYSLDMNQIRNQVRDYAKQEFGPSDQGLPLYGDYYGTYAGDDSGVFSFHMDASGHVSGTGESRALGIVFTITGNITPNGVMRMSAAIDEVKAGMAGQMDAKTGKFSGSWSVPGLPQDFSAAGSFSGQHE